MNALDAIAEVLTRSLRGHIMRSGAMGGPIVRVKVEEEDEIRPLRLLFTLDLGYMKNDYPFTQKTPSPESNNPLIPLQKWEIVSVEADEVARRFDDGVLWAVARLVESHDQVAMAGELLFESRVDTERADEADKLFIKQAKENGNAKRESQAAISNSRVQSYADYKRECLAEKGPQ